VVLGARFVSANPVENVGRLLSQQDGVRERARHQPAMPWRDIPAFIHDKVRAGRVSVTKTMLEFVILTAARFGEVRAMTWSEVDLVAKVWTVSCCRFRGRRETVFHEAGGWLWRDGYSVGSSR
jgi:integrase